jgi:hypothetical protein
VPINAQQDDIICLLYGCSLPMLLCPCNKSGTGPKYTVVGECYVQQAMMREKIVMAAAFSKFFGEELPHVHVAEVEDIEAEKLS